MYGFDTVESAQSHDCVCVQGIASLPANLKVPLFDHLEFTRVWEDDTIVRVDYAEVLLYGVV